MSLSDFIPKLPRPKGARTQRSYYRDPNKPSPSGQTLPPPRHGYLKSFDGTRIFYSVEGSGPPLVFCYGLVCSSLHWTYQIDYFRDRYTTIWFDYRGHQNSDTPQDLTSLTLQNIATDLGYVLDTLEIKEAVLLGHSMGVNIVLEFFRQHPERAKALILANGTARRPLETLFHMNATEIGFKLLRKFYEISPQTFEKFWRAQSDNPITRQVVGRGGFNVHLSAPEDIALYVKQVTSMDPRVFLQLIENYETVDATSWLHEIDKPTLIISGEQDHMTPTSEQELMHQLIKNSQLEFIKHGSHCAQMDLPDLINSKIEKFLNQIKY